MAGINARVALLAALAAALVPGTVRAGWDIELVDLYTQRWEPGGNGPRATSFLPGRFIQVVCVYRYAWVGKPDATPFKSWSGIFLWDGKPKWPAFLGEDPGWNPLAGEKNYQVVTQGVFDTPGQHTIGCRLNTAKPGLPEDNLDNNSRTISVTILPPPAKIGDKGPALQGEAGPRLPVAPPSAANPGTVAGTRPIQPGARADLVFDSAVIVGNVTDHWGGSVTVPESAATFRGSGVCQVKLSSVVRNAGQLAAGPFKIAADTPDHSTMNLTGLSAGGWLPVGLFVNLKPGWNTVKVALVPSKTAAETSEREKSVFVKVDVIGTCFGMLPPVAPTTAGARK